MEFRWGRVAMHDVISSKENKYTYTCKMLHKKLARWARSASILSLGVLPREGDGGGGSGFAGGSKPPAAPECITLGMTTPSQGIWEVGWSRARTAARFQPLSGLPHSSPPPFPPKPPRGWDLFTLFKFDGWLRESHQA